MPTIDGFSEESKAGYGPFSIVQRVGSGGAGVVFEAVHRETGRRVAVKTVMASSAWARASLRQEIAVLKRLDHPGIVHIFDDGLSDGGVWYAMELLDGRSLADFHRTLFSGSQDKGESSPETSPSKAVPTFADREEPGAHDRSPRPMDEGDERKPPVSSAPCSDESSLGPVAGGKLPEILRLYADLCAALDFVHARGLVHGDIKPGNVFIRNTGTPVLLDFGLSQYAASGRDRLDSGVKGLGTPRYAAPEKLAGERSDARSDIYSLGCMLYESLTGKTPFPERDFQQLIWRQMHERPRPPSRQISGCPPELDALVMRMLDKAREQRPYQVSEIGAVLEALLGPAEPRRFEGKFMSRLHRPRLSGREDVIDTLDRFCNRLEVGKGGLVLLRGESGIGKTFLLSEMARRAAFRRVRIVTGECLPLSPAKGDGAAELSAPLRTFAGLLQATADMCSENGNAALPIVGPWCGVLAAFEPALGRYAPRPSEPHELPLAAARDRLFTALRASLLALCSDRPLFVLLDDLHWADELTLSFLSSIQTRFLENSPVLLIGAYRAEETPEALATLSREERVTNLRLGHLNTPAIERMVGDMMGEPAPPRVIVDSVLGISEGNPYFAAEYLRVLVAEEAMFRAEGRWQARQQATDFHDRLTVGSLESVIARRLSYVSGPVRAVLEGGAVLGRTFELSQLADLLDETPDALEPVLEIARQREIVQQVAGGYRFLHDKLRQVVYEASDRHRRGALHQKAAIISERLPLDEATAHERSARIAHHYRSAGVLDKALAHLIAAGEVAISTFAYREAISFLQAALDLRERLGIADSIAKARLLRLIADAFQGLGDMSASESHLVSAAASLGYPVPTGKARMGAALLRQIFVQIGHRLFPSRLARHGAPDPRRTAEAARVYDRLQQVNFYRGEGLSIFFCGVTSLNVAELAAPSAELATAYTNAHAVAGAVPARKLSEAYFERATQALKIRPDPVVESYLMTLTGVYRTGDGQWEEADRALTRAATLAEELGFRRRMEEALGGLGISSFFQGNFEDAVRFSTKQLESGKRGDPQTQCWGLLGRAQALLLSQQLPDAVADIEQAAAFLPALGRSEEIWSNGLRALCALYAGDLARASAHADTLADKIAEAPPIAHYCLIAYGAVSEVRLADFRKKRTRSARLASDRACRAETAATRVFRVAKPRAWLRRGVYFWISGKRTKAVRMWKRALDEATSLGTPYEAMLAHQLLATSLGHPTGTDRSASHAQQAAQLAARLRLNRETRPAWWPW